MEEAPQTGRSLESAAVELASVEVPFARPICWTAPIDPLLLLDESRKDAWVDLGWLLLFLVAIELGLVVTMRLVFVAVLGAGFDPTGPDFDSLRQAVLLPAISMRALGACVLIIVVCRRRRQSARTVGLGARSLVLDSGVGVGAVLVAYGLMLVVMHALFLLFPALAAQMNENRSRLVEMLPDLNPLEFAPVAAMIGLYEELIFRGFLLIRLRRALGYWTPAVLLSTVVFTALHSFDQTPAALIIVTILSLVFSLVTIWRRSIIPAIVAHTLFDYSQFVFLYLFAGDAGA